MYTLGIDNFYTSLEVVRVLLADKTDYIEKHALKIKLRISNGKIRKIC